MRLNSISSRKDFLCFGSQMELELNWTGLALRSSFTPGCIFIILIPIAGHGRRGPAPAPAPYSYANPKPTACATPIPAPDDSGRAMHIQLTFQLKSLCKAAATKGAPTKRKASKVRTSSKPELSAVQTPGSSDQ
ncbi:GM24750 [Drosophila sechellia]|uniref:GM24750 n=1 Tax=Drosophila sechellia TaxID=7238 RepID=B4HEE4_DROSE|nr:GM24750 [Drosophila sechellia]